MTIAQYAPKPSSITKAKSTISITGAFLSIQNPCDYSIASQPYNNELRPSRHLQRSYPLLLIRPPLGTNRHQQGICTGYNPIGNNESMPRRKMPIPIGC